MADLHHAGGGFGPARGWTAITLSLTFPKSEAEVPRPALAHQPPPRPGDEKALSPGAPNQENPRRYQISIFNATQDAWQVVPGDYQVHAGGASRDTPLHGALASERIDRLLM